jgi:hypothetical protein
MMFDATLLDAGCLTGLADPWAGQNVNGVEISAQPVTRAETSFGAVKRLADDA